MKYNLKNGLALSFDGVEWLVEGGGKSFQLKSSGDFRRVVSLLEISFDDAAKELGPGFNYSEVILAGLDSGSDYWVGLALSWVDESTFGASHDVVGKLRELISLDQLSQQARSKAKKLISRNE